MSVFPADLTLIGIEFHRVGAACEKASTYIHTYGGGAMFPILYVKHIWIKLSYSKYKSRLIPHRFYIAIAIIK